MLAKDFLDELWALDQDEPKQILALIERWESRTALNHEQGTMWVRMFTDGSLLAQPETGLPIMTDRKGAQRIMKKLGWDNQTTQTGGESPQEFKMSNPMETLQQCIGAIQYTRQELDRAKRDHNDALHHAVGVLMREPKMVEEYLHRNPATIEAVLRLGARQ